MSKIPDIQLKAILRTLPEVKTSATLVTRNNRHWLHTRPIDFFAFIKRLEARITPEWGSIAKLQALLIRMDKDRTINFTFAVESAL